MSEYDLESKSYDTGKIGNYDYRFEIGKKDTLVLHSLGFICTLIATIWMYALGTGDPERMSYLFGLPLWVSGAIVIYLVMFVIGIAYIVKWKEFSLSAKDAKGGGK
jgi:hypothetical protein